MISKGVSGLWVVVVGNGPGTTLTAGFNQRQGWAPQRPPPGPLPEGEGEIRAPVDAFQRYRQVISEGARTRPSPQRGGPPFGARWVTPPAPLEPKSSVIRGRAVVLPPSSF